jgi:RNA ligase
VAVLLQDILDPAELENDIRERLINVQNHPTLPLRIFNYSHTAAFAPIWSRSMTICRGLIVDADNIVIARPFQKFWNYGDPRHPETMPDNLPSGLPLLTEKQDGSLLLGFKYGDHTGVATRGSFTSEQAKWAATWVQKYLPNLDWPPGWTPVWEMIANFNRIVVDYGGWEGLIALALIDNQTGEEASRLVLEAWAKAQGFSPTPLVNKQLETCGADEVPNFEGYVSTWHKMGGAPHRVKLKQETYCKLHRIITGLNPRTIWEMLSANENEAIDALLSDQNLPDAFKAWFSNWVEQLRSKYSEMEKEALVVFKGRPGCYRKDNALYFQQTPALCSVLFAMLDGKNFEDIIWKQLKPRGDAVFQQDIDS